MNNRNSNEMSFIEQIYCVGYPISYISNIQPRIAFDQNNLVRNDLNYTISIPAISTNGYVANNAPRFISRNRDKAENEYNLGNLLQAYNFCKLWLIEEGENPDCYSMLSSITLRLRRFDESLQYAEKAINLNPLLTEPYIFKGLVLKEYGNVHDAMLSYRVALKINSDHPEALIAMANGYLALNYIDDALRYCAIAVQKNPDSLICRHELGNMLKLSGRFEEAKQCYENVIARKLDYGPAWLNLGYIHISLGSIWLAMFYFERALTYDPLILDCYLAYGNTLKELKLTDKALNIFIKAQNIFRNNAQIYACLGNCYHELGYIDFAIENYKVAIAIFPNYADAYCNLANVYKDKCMYTEAENCYNSAIKINNGHADSYNNLANIYREQGRLVESIHMYNKAIEIAPHFYAPHSNLASIYQQMSNYPKAIYHYQLAIAVNGTNTAETHLHLGNVYKEIGNFQSALECYNKSLQISPINPDGHALIGNLYKDVGSLGECISHLTMALKLRPNYNDVYCNLIHCYQLMCEWTDYDARMKKLVTIVSEQIDNDIRCPSVHPHHTMLYPLTGKLRLLIASRNSQMCKDRNRLLGYTKVFEHILPTVRVKRIKVGYVSSDFCNHPTSHLIQSIPGLHDRSKFEIFCYSLTPNDGSSFYKKIKTQVEHFIDVSNIVDNLAVSEIIKTHQIDILLNLNGYTKGARNEIFSLKPSPIQVMYLGYPGTSGSDYMDYIITDKVTSPPEYSSHYSEKYAYMPNSFFIGDHANMFPHLLKCLRVDSHTHHENHTKIEQYMTSNNTTTKSIDNPLLLEYVHDETTLNEYINSHVNIRRKEYEGCKDSGDMIPDIKNCYIDRKYLNLHVNKFVYCNFNQLYKLDPNTFNCWCRILNRVPNSVLWLLRFPKYGEDNLRNTALLNGISQERLIFTDVTNKEEHIRRGQLADVCLDTPLCNGHTTGMDVLWSGCPIVTMPLESFASRVGASILTSIGCQELIASNYEQYEEIAVRLGTDTEYYHKFKQLVWFNRITSSLFNLNQYAHNFDCLLNKIYDQYLETGKLEPITN